MALSETFPRLLELFALFALGLAVVLFLPVFFFLARWMLRRARTIMARTAVTSSQGQSQGGIGRGPPLISIRGFFLSAALIGLYVWLLAFILPAIHASQAQKWAQVPCVVTSSGVESHPGEDSASYQPVIEYRYWFAEREYRSARYSFPTRSSSEYADARAIIDQYPAGAERYCWVNPNDPSQAVLNRDVHTEAVSVLIPPLFIALGIGGLVWSQRFKSVLDREFMGPSSREQRS